MALTALKNDLKGNRHENFKPNSTRNKEEQRHAETIKNLKQMVIADFKNKFLSRSVLWVFKTKIS
ncbi:hypothetical protein HpMMM27_11810 [Helicobacter pylori]